LKKKELTAIEIPSRVILAVNPWIAFLSSEFIINLDISNAEGFPSPVFPIPYQ